MGGMRIKTITKKNPANQQDLIGSVHHSNSSLQTVYAGLCGNSKDFRLDFKTG